MDKKDQDFLLGVYASNIKPGPMTEKGKSFLKCMGFIGGFTLFIVLFLALVFSTMSA